MWRRAFPRYLVTLTGSTGLRVLLVAIDLEGRQIKRIVLEPCEQRLLRLQAINVLDERQDPGSDIAFDITGPFGTVMTCLVAVCISPNRHLARTMRGQFRVTCDHRIHGRDGEDPVVVLGQRGQSDGLRVRRAAIEPSPLPVSPWHVAHLALYSTLPKSTRSV